MNKTWAVVVLLAVISVAPACGSNNRQLQSITITAVANGSQIQFVATGTFSAAPTTVSPLPVSWSFAPPPPQYNLTTQPFTFNCTSTGPYASPVVAMAPANPDAAGSGSMSTTKMISASGPITCL
jgi:hypothetical protein